jgi:hypothetical protein
MGCFYQSISSVALCRVVESVAGGVSQVLRSGFVLETAVTFIVLSLLLSH